MRPAVTFIYENELTIQIVSLGLDEQDSNRSNLTVYENSFQTAFLAATETYYSQESSQFLAENTVSEYLKKAEARLKEEEDRVEMYLHSSTRKAVRHPWRNGIGADVSGTAHPQV